VPRINVREITIYHNPRCSKSRQTLALLESRGLSPRIVEYLATPLSTAELTAIIAKLGIRAEQLVRKGEEIYKRTYAGRSMTDAEWVEAMVENPILIERPIVVADSRAVFGRPPERVLELLGP
jgi:arsenate reductase